MEKRQTTLSGISGTEYMRNVNNDDLSRFWFIVSNAVPPIGLFLYFKHRNQ